MRIDLRAVLLVAAIPAVAASADEIYLKSGGQFSGRIISRTDTSVEMDIGSGKIGVPMSSVLRIEDGHSALQEYEDRAGRLAAGDAEGWLALGQWASDHGLGTQAREAYNRVLAVSPADARANEALGNVQVNGRWVSQEESYRAKGYVQFEGDWMTPAEQQAILRDRAAESQQALDRQQADARAREAEARAQEAEAQARKAEAEASSNQGIPLWYGWAVGPTAWPTGPVITQPIVRPGTGRR